MISPRFATKRPKRTFAIVAAAVAVVPLVVTVATASGSTPNAGTLSATSGALKWTGGPFVAPNVTGTAGAVDCTVPQSCDDYALTVATPPGTGNTKNLTISVGWTNTAADFDVYLLDSAGNTVASSASSADPETIVVPPNSGSYTVRVVPYTPLGSSYSASATLTTKPNDSAPGSSAPTPTVRNYPAPAALSDAHNAGEPSIGVDAATNATYYQAYLSTYQVAFNDAVKPATAAWKDVSANATNGCVVGSTQSLDPILYTDRTTGRTFESQLSGLNSLTCYTDDGGQTWFPSTGGGIPSGVDHQTLGGGNFVASDPLNALNTYPRAVYYCSQDIATAFCALSRDGGTTFGNGVPTYSLLDCAGLHGHIMVAPDGTAYLPNKSCGGKQAVVVSGDDGKTWTVHTVPHSLPSDSDPAVAIGANGTVYFTYASADGTEHVAVSYDKGVTWPRDYNVGAKFGVKNSVFPTAVAGDDNRAAVSWIGTKAGGNYQDATNFKGVWHVYTAYTYDAGKTWKTIDDTPTDPVQRGSICTGGTTCGNDRNLLDFIGSTVDAKGRVEVGYADGCTGPCVKGTTNNFDAYATIARQTSGLGLYAAFDPKPDLTVTALTAQPIGGHQYRLTATMSNAGTVTATAPLSFVADRKTIATSSAKTLAPGQSIDITTTWTAKSGQHNVVAVADPTNTVSESNEGNNRREIKVIVP